MYNLIINVCIFVLVKCYTNILRCNITNKNSYIVSLILYFVHCYYSYDYIEFTII